MISTRTHGSIDYAVALLFGGLAASSRLPLSARAIFGSAGAYHAAYSAVTDYEAGVTPALGMGQHLVLDAAGAAALLGAGVMLRRQPAAVRLLLLAAGLAECVVIARSSAVPGSGPGSPAGLTGRMLGVDGRPMEQVGELPLDMPKPVAPDVFVVDGILRRPLGVVLPVRMTVIRLPTGGLLLYSPTRLTPGLRTALESLGPIRHLVAPNIEHWLFLKQWQQAYPDAITWAPPGLRKRRQVRSSGVRVNHDLGATTPREWGGIEMVPVPGLGFREMALFHRASGTLVLADLVLDLPRDQVPALLRPIAGWLDIVGSDGKPPVYVRAVIKLRRRAARAAAQRLLALHPDRVVFSHGPWFRQNGTVALRHALRWLLPD